MKCFLAEGFSLANTPSKIKTRPKPAGISQVPGLNASPRLLVTSDRPPTFKKTVAKDKKQRTSPKNIVMTGMGFLEMKKPIDR
jgi:hypothetical protein